MSDDQTPTDGLSTPPSEGPAPATSSLLPLPPPNYQAPPAGPPVIHVRIPLVDDLPPKQRRWTIALRWLLLIPQFIVLIFVVFGGFLVAVAAWFSALVLGRVPEGLASFLRIVVRWLTRVNASNMLLTDAYPPFNGDEESNYPIGVEFPPSGRLNRWSVLFRFILVIPAYFVGACIQVGFFVFNIVLWIAALILGRLPDPMYRAAATGLRYNARLYSYAWMLTSEYGWGWKGDDVLATQSSIAAPTTEGPSSYWTSVTPVSEAPAPVETTRFDFHLAGWSLAWIWIWFVIGILDYAIQRK
ncbi:MAG TPA: DUF4389 domain-containing protein [Acidimicrobiales bacterium]